MGWGMIETVKSFLLSIEGTVVLAGGIVLVGRFNHAFRRGLTRSESATRLARLIWTLFLFILLAGTVHHPMVSGWKERSIGGWFARILRVVFAVGAYMMTAQACFGFAPSLRPKRWNWPLVLGVVTILSYVTIVAVFDYGGAFLPSSPEYYWEYAADPLFHFYVLLIAIRTVLPALELARRREGQRPIQLQFALMSATHVAVVIWMMNDMVHDLGVVVGFGYEARPAYHISILLFASTFLFSYFMPATYFVSMVRLLDYLSDLINFLPVRFLQVQCLSWVGHAISRINTRALFADPGTLLYQDVIGTLDTRKALKLHGESDANELGRQLDQAADPHIGYSQVVDRLRTLGWREMARRLPLCLPNDLSRNPCMMLW